MVHGLALVDVDVGGSFTAPPFWMGFAAGEPLLAHRSFVGVGRTPILGAKFTALLGSSRELFITQDTMIPCFGAAAVCSSFCLLFLAPTPVMKVVGLALALFAVVIVFQDMGCDGAQLRLNFCQLFDQFLGIGWNNVVQTIVLVLNLDGYLSHQETAHGEQGH